MRVGTKYGLIPSDDIDIDVYDHVPLSLKRYFGDILGAEFTSIDDKGVVRYEKIVSNSGLVTIAASTKSPYLGRNTLLMTSNTSATTII